MIKRRILEMLLDQVRLAQRGRDVPGESRHVLRVSLVWPRMAIAHKTAVRAVVFRDGVYRPVAASWTDRVLFKETVEGPFGVRVEVSEAMSNAQWSDAVARFGGTLWSLAGARFVDMVENPAAALLWRAPFDALARAATAAARDEPRPIAAGMLDMQCESWATLQEKRLLIDMTAPADIVRTTRQRVAGKLQSRQTVLLKEGASNGKAVLIARVYG